MNSERYSEKQETCESIDDLINEMKNELIRGIRAKGKAYCFDFEQDTPIYGNKILWLEDHPIVH